MKVPQDCVHRVVSRTSSLNNSLSLKTLRAEQSEVPPGFNNGKSKWSRLLFSQDFSDLYIRISAAKEDNDNKAKELLIPCHKLVLIVNSPFFWSLLKKSEDLDVIRFIDFSPEAIRVFLRYLYTEELDPSVWQSYEILLHVMELAQKFEVPALRQVCIQNLPQIEINAENAFSMWQRAREFEESEVEELAIRFISENVEKLCSCLPEGFLNLTYENLKALLARDDLQVDELALFNSVSKWSQHQCEKRGMQLSRQSVRRVLKNAIYLIRFPLMSTSVFTNLIIKTGLLSTDEIAKIYRLMYRQEESEVDGRLNNSESRSFSTKSRRKPGPVFTVNRFSSTSSQEQPCSDKFHTVLFSSDKSVALAGFAFFTVSPKELKNQDMEKTLIEFEVQLQKFEGTQFTFASVHKTYTLKEAMAALAGSKKTLQVKFEYPVTIQPSIWYHVQYKIIGPPTLIGKEEARTDKVTINCKGRGEVTFSFKSLPETSSEDNQLAALLFKVF